MGARLPPAGRGSQGSGVPVPRPAQGGTAQRVRPQAATPETQRKPTGPAEYRLADDTYAMLARTLAENHFAAAAAPLRENLLAFFADPAKPVATRRHKRKWRDTMRALGELRQPSAAASGP